MNVTLDAKPHCAEGVALVTCGGIGRSVALADIVSRGAVETQEMISRAGGAAIAIAAEGMIAAVIARLGRLGFAANGAGIFNIAAGAGSVASKHGVVGLTRAAAIEYTKLGIWINAVCPGFNRMPMSLKSMAETPGLTEEFAAAAMPIGRVGESRAVADVVLWLCSEQASFMVGSAIPVDGGYTVI